MIPSSREDDFLEELRLHIEKLRLRIEKPLGRRRRDLDEVLSDTQPWGETYVQGEAGEVSGARRCSGIWTFV